MGTKPKKAPSAKAIRTTKGRSAHNGLEGAEKITQAGDSTNVFSVQLLSGLRDPSLIADADDLQILAVNPGVEILYGYSGKELLRLDLTALSHTSQRASARSKWLSPESARKEFQHQRKDGSVITIEVQPSKGTFDGRPAFLCVLHEVTSRTRLVQALLESDAVNREIIENASDIIYTHDLEGNFTSGNKAVEKILGYSREEAVKLNIQDIVVPDDQDHARQAILAKLSGKPLANPYRLRVKPKTGELLHLEVSTRLIQRDGVPVGVQGIARDISDRIRVEAALRESEAKFRAVSESAPCAILIYQDSRFRYVNPACEAITGYSNSELLSLEHFWDLAAPEHQEVIQERSAARIRGEFILGRYEFKIVHKNGEQRWMDFTATNIAFEGQPAVLVMIFDITDRKRAEDAVAQSQQLFRMVIENSTDIISIVEQDGTIRYESPSLKNVLGYDPHEVIGKNGFDFIHPEDRERAASSFAKSFSGPRSGTAVELRMRDIQGEYHQFEAVGNPLKETAGPPGLLISFRDVTERKRSELELRASEERYRHLFQRNLAGVYASTLSGQMVDCNDSFAKIYGYQTRDELLLANANALYMSSHDRQIFIERLLQNGSLTNLETLGRRRDGTPVWVLENVVLLDGLNGGPKLIQGTLLDISERKNTEQALLESESKFRAVADTASSAIYIHNGKRFLYVNRASEEISGYSSSELLRMNPFDIVHPDDHAFVLERGSSRQIGQPAPARYEYRIRRKDGTDRWVDFSAGMIQFEGQAAIIGTAFDISERKRVEALQSALFRISERATYDEELDQFFSAIHSILGELMDVRNLYIALYDEATRTLTYPYYADEADDPPQGTFPLGRGFTEYVLRKGSHLLATPEITRELEDTGEIERVGTDCVDWLGVPLKTGNKTVGVLAVQSYTESIRYSEQQVEILNYVSQHIANAILRKRNEEARRESEFRFRTMVQSAVYGIYRSSASDHFIEVNPALVAMLGYDAVEEVMNLSISRQVYADAAERELLIRKHSLSGRIEGVEVKWQRKDNKLITVRLSGRAILDARNKPQYFEMIVEDVTEKRALEEQLRQSQKMEAVGRLAGGVAHDFNNLLTVIKGYSELMLDDLKEADPMYAEVEEIKKAADRAATLTRQLLAFSRQQVLAPKILDLNAVVSNMDKLLNRLLGEDVSLFTVLESGLGRVRADPGQIEQVVMNLAVNARDALPRGGKLTIETANVDLDESYARDHVGARPGSYVMLAVSDNGTGMSPEIRQRIFEPFFTTKELGKGTGLGLSTVYGIVKQSEGYIWVSSEPSMGTSFKVYLPRVDAPADVATSRTHRKPTFKGTETVLLVEDEDGVRALVRQVLHKHGYTVLEARHGGEALLHCERHEGPIQLLLTDVVLEQMGGPELAQRLSGIRPDMKVLYISGYTDDAIIHHGVLTEGTAFLQKPFTTEALARKIRQVLDV